VGNLVWLAISAAMHGTRSFSQVLIWTLKILSDVQGFSATSIGRQRLKAKHRSAMRGSKHDPRSGDPTAVSEEAFTKARRLLSPKFWREFLGVLVERFEAVHDQWTHWKGFRLLALDGTTIALPGWKGLADYFGSIRNHQGECAPLARLTLLQFPLARIPYRYELTPFSEGEKTVAERLIDYLRANDLLLLDRGFWSYGLFWRIQHCKAFFGIRLMKTVNLKTLQRLGKKDRLVSWTPADRRWQQMELPPAITLRVIDYQIKGFRPSAVVTNVLDPLKISRDEWVRLTTQTDTDRRLDPGLYHRRWEIETTFFELKISQGMKSQLRSRTPEGIAYEVAGHLLLYFLIRALMVESAVAHGEDPLRLSFTGAVREIMDLHQALITATPQRAASVLLPRLLARIAAHRIVWRPGRYYDRPNDTKIRYKGRGKYRIPSKIKPISPKRKNRSGRAA